MTVSSAEAGCAKPDPAIFRMALAEAGCTPQAAVMIGDRPDNEIAPAKRLGMRTVWVRRGFARFRSAVSADEEPDITVDRLAQVVQAPDAPLPI